MTSQCLFDELKSREVEIPHRVILDKALQDEGLIEKHERVGAIYFTRGKWRAEVLYVKKN